MGPKRPSATSRPPPVSPSPAANASARPGRNPTDSKKAPVPAIPYPPNQPNSFCAPCAAIRVPNTSRATSNPEFISVPPLIERLYKIELLDVKRLIANIYELHYPDDVPTDTAGHWPQPRSRLHR